MRDMYAVVVHPLLLPISGADDNMELCLLTIRKPVTV